MEHTITVEDNPSTEPALVDAVIEAAVEAQVATRSVEELEALCLTMQATLDQQTERLNQLQDQLAASLAAQALSAQASLDAAAAALLAQQEAEAATLAVEAEVMVPDEPTVSPAEMQTPLSDTSPMAGPESAEQKEQAERHWLVDNRREGRRYL